MENSNDVILFAAVFLIVTLAILAAIFLSSNRINLFQLRTVFRRKSYIEQKLLRETIAACAGVLDLKTILVTLGDRAAGSTGYDDWVIWLCRDDQFRIAEEKYITTGTKATAENTSAERRFYDWVKQNAEPVAVNASLMNVAETGIMKSVLQRLGEGILIPFTDKADLLGFVIVGGERTTTEKRSDHYLNLFGAFASIVIKNSLLSEQKEKLDRIEKLASLGKVAAGLAHEIRNPLALIKVSTQHLKKKYRYQPEDELISDDIVLEIDRLNSQVEDLLVLGRIDPKKFDEVDVTMVVDNVVRLVQHNARLIGVAVDVKSETGPVILRGNEELLRQLFLNLILNAMEAIGNEGEIHLVVNTDADFATIDFSDTGPGIDPAVANRLFEPFVTTKESGTGLGLSMGFSIAQAHGGLLELMNTGRDGTVFRVTLPLLR